METSDDHPLHRDGPAGRVSIFIVSICVVAGALFGVALGGITIATQDSAPTVEPLLELFSVWNASLAVLGVPLGLLIGKRVPAPRRSSGALTIACGVLIGAGALLAGMQPADTGWPLTTGPLLTTAVAAMVSGTAMIARAR